MKDLVMTKREHVARALICWVNSQRNIGQAEWDDLYPQAQIAYLEQADAAIKAVEEFDEGI